MHEKVFGVAWCYVTCKNSVWEDGLKLRMSLHWCQIAKFLYCIFLPHLHFGKIITVHGMKFCVVFFARWEPGEEKRRVFRVRFGLVRYPRKLPPGQNLPPRSLRKQTTSYKYRFEFGRVWLTLVGKRNFEISKMRKITRKNNHALFLS